ncbi:fumarylacetoacetase [Brevundimonas naejangsanensis]|uniref:fumarylacetoacetase n=1 Tax=Brevundimonas naejangsanensis TaxID=588932 RepID=A0A494RH52_9CAUL|nr:fumarylacetoacetase [Brevundimonas naejangsanensis]AYG95748.1 fumarylacetoacetase [Brevundimonas naejangsanensis]
MSRPVVDHTHAPDLKTWVEGANGHADFPVQNLPLGVFSPRGGDARIGVAIGDFILDVRAAFGAGLLPGQSAEALEARTLNTYMGLPASQRRALRHALSALLTEDANAAKVQPLLHPAADCTMHLPAQIGDYTDFYVGIHHAMNVGALFRPENPLLPNYKHVPIGYHGRASSIRVSGTPVVRPNGQTKAPTAEAPSFGPTKRLDYELEIGVWIGAGNELGQPIRIEDALNHVAGFCLLNDWSARDFQAWEYQPLGPFLAKNFMSTISPWVITIEAMAPFFVAQKARPQGDPQPLPYIWDEADQAGGALSVDLKVSITSEAMRKDGVAAMQLSEGPATNMYWTVAQIVTHHASNGCNLNPGDLLGSGTISAPERSGFGSLMEITRGGAEPVEIPGGVRTFAEDGDQIALSARATADGYVSIGFGPCEAIIKPALPLA